MSLQLITQPAVEPVSVVDMMGQLGMSAPTDDALDSQLEAQIRGLTMAARRQCENFTRRAFITQRWKYTLDHFPYSDGRYDLPRAYDIPLPLPNFQGLDAFTYIDPGATVQDMLAADSWGFQVVSGGDTLPAKIRPPYWRAWPITLWEAADAVSFTYTCGYGTSVTASMSANSAILTGPVFTRASVGQSVSVPGALAGTPAATLNTSILSIDSNGQATLAAPATVAVPIDDNNVWVGEPVPEDIVLAIKLLAQFLFQNGADVDLPIPRVIQLLLSPYVNEGS
jgi:hypothetical protein